MTTICSSMDQPASSLPLTCSSIPSFEDLTKPIYTAPPMGYYHAMQSAQGWGMQPCDEPFMLQENLPRATSHTSVLTDAEHHIQYIDTNGATIDFYPPTPESPESRQQHCHHTIDCTGLHGQLYEFAPAHPQVINHYPRTTPSPKGPMKSGE